MSEADDLVAALAPVAAAFRSVGVRHYVGGSVASTLHGAIRSTMDVDLVCDLRGDQVEAFLAACGNDFYRNVPTVRQAVDQRSCFNLIHLPTAYKIDVFVSRGRPFDVLALERATVRDLGVDRSLAMPVATVEDSIVSKLEWFRLGDEASERQWGDVSRLLALHGDALDVGHMRDMARSVGVADLLERLVAEGR
ncbi:MAG: hypothetical protein ACKON7_06955 [Planctomycetaceae bacterium]